MHARSPVGDGISRVGALLSLAAALLFAALDVSAENPRYVFKPAPAPGVVAMINGRQIMEEELMSHDPQNWYRLQQNVYNFRMTALQNKMKAELLMSEAGKAGLSVDSFVASRILTETIVVSEQEIRSYAERQGWATDSMAPELGLTIRDYLIGAKREKLILNHVARLTQEHPVEVYISEPILRLNVEPGPGPSRGAETAPVQMVVFSDFQCPYCAQYAEMLGEIFDSYRDDIRITARQLPLDMHSHARKAAEAALCVAEQNPDLYWTFQDLIFQNRDPLDATALERIAANAGADTEVYRASLLSGRASSRIQEDMDYAAMIGARSTPTTYVNGRQIVGAASHDKMIDILEEELSRTKATQAPTASSLPPAASPRADREAATDSGNARSKKFPFTAYR